jgi:signal peptidase I
MNEDGEIEDELPSWEAEAEDQEPQPEPPYDPLTEPWNDPVSTSVREYNLSPQRGESALPSSEAPAHAGAYPQIEELSELRRRLREQTVVIPKRSRAPSFAPRGILEMLVVVLAIGVVVLAPGFLLEVSGISDGSLVSYAVAAAVAAGVVLAVALISAMLSARTTADSTIPANTSGFPAETVAIPRPRRVWTVTTREVAETLLLAVLIFLAVRASMQNFRVEGASMEPSLDNGEYLIVNKLAYAEIDLSLFDWLPFYDSGDDPVRHLWSSPDRGDVVVFRSPTNVRRDFIKRIIGVPGDVVQIDRTDGVVTVNGEILDESYVDGKTTCSGSCGPWVVPERAYFVMGDNRQNSSDSRQGWFVPEENIIGKALITYWHDGNPDVDLAPNQKASITSEAAAEE